MSEVTQERRRASGHVDAGVPEHVENGRGISRRRMVGYLLAAPTLVAAARLGLTTEDAQAAIPTVQPVDHYDLSDILTGAAQPTMPLLKVTVNKDGTAAFELPRAEVGQGITTAIAMTIADEMDLPIDKVHVTLADAKPELAWNQLTGGSNSMHALYEPVRTAAAAARGQAAQTAARELGVSESDLSLSNGVFRAPGGSSLSYGDLAEQAAVSSTRRVTPKLKARAAQKIVGADQPRVDALAAVTGQKVFAMDLNVPNALPTMVCRPPTINGHAAEIVNESDVKKMPGVTDVVMLEHNQFVQGGVAVRARTFGQCIDAVRVLRVKWGPGSVEGKSASDVATDLKNAELPMSPAAPGDTIEQLFTFHFRPGDPLETNCAVADVRSDRAEIWSSLKSPIWAKEQIATSLGIPLDKTIVHVTEGGGSFGRHLFCDAAFEAAWISKKIGKPVKLMWHRTDSFRHGRVHPMATSRVRITRSGGNVLAYDQRHTSVATDFTQGIGELLTSMDTSQPGQNFAQFSETVFKFTANVPYNFGNVTQELNEIYEFNTFNTSSTRNVYSPDVTTSKELMVDRVAAAMGKDPVLFRREFVRDDRLLAVLNKAASAGNWGRPMPAGTAQGIALHKEYKGVAATLVEIDCRPATVNRKVKHAYTGPRVTRVVVAVDVGLPINPLGLKAQLMGATMDGIANALSYSLHLKDGAYLEGSWDDAHYTRQWNTPPKVDVIVMPPTSDSPGGAGELGVAPSMAATACAYARATGQMPTTFPINYDGPLFFEPFPTVPPIPQSPTNGLAGVRPKAKKKRRRRSSTNHANPAH
jgi:isoquinoline 1-oxidoreductase subunit beta